MSDGNHDAMDGSGRERLAALHPEAAPILHDQGAARPRAWDDSDEGVRTRLRSLREIILGFPRGSGAGPSGLRPQHLQDILRTDAGASASLLAAVDSFVKMCLDGEVPQSATPFLCAANLVPLKKPPTPEGQVAIRPVAVGETLRRIVSKVAMHSPHTTEEIQSFLPFQCGVGVEGACETVAQGLQQFVCNANGSDWLLLQLDLSNAFNSIDRRAMLEEVRQRVPSLFGWVQTCYAPRVDLRLVGRSVS